MLISLIVSIILQCTCITKCHAIYFKYIQFLFVNQTSKKPEKNYFRILLPSDFPVDVDKVDMSIFQMFSHSTFISI